MFLRNTGKKKDWARKVDGLVAKKQVNLDNEVSVQEPLPNYNNMQLGQSAKNKILQKSKKTVLSLSGP